MKEHELTRVVLEGRTYSKDDKGAFVMEPKRVREFDGNPRRTFRGISRLAASIKQLGQRVPGQVILTPEDPDYDAELVDGARRLRACREAGVNFRGYPVGEIGDMETQFSHAFFANYGKEDHDCMETASGIARLLASGMTLEQIATGAGKSITWASQHNRLNSLHPQVQEMLVPGEDEEDDAKRFLTLSLALLIVPLPAEIQLRVAREITDGKMNLAQARRHTLRQLREAGHSPTKHTCGRKQARSLGSLGERLRDSVGVYLDMPDSELDQMIQSTGVAVQLHMLKAMSELHEELGQLVEVLGKKIRPATQTANPTT